MAQTPNWTNQLLTQLVKFRVARRHFHAHLSVKLCLLGGHMTTLKGEEIDYSGTPLNKGGLVASVGVDHQAILQRLPKWDPEKQ